MIKKLSLLVGVVIKWEYRYMLCKSLRKSALFFFLVFFPIQPLYAQDAPVSDAELLLLPPYCQAILGKRSNAKKLWYQRLRECKGITHYCRGVNWLNRAKASVGKKQEYRYALSRVIGETSYVLARWPETNCPLLKQAQENKNMAEIMRKSKF